MYQGKLIVLEGPDQVGRSLHARLLSARLESHGVATFTIGLARSTLMGELLKSHTHHIHQLNWRTRALLYATDLHDQILNGIEPLLEAGFVVISDRYDLTPKIRESVRGGDPDWIKSLYSEIPKPDSVIILHCGPRRLLNRIMFGEKLESLNNFESGMDMGISTSITSSFLKYQKLLRDEFTKAGKEIDATLIPTRDSVEIVHNKIWESLQPIVGDLIQPINDS